MKLVATFVPGTVVDAVAKVNEFNLCYEFADIMAGAQGTGFDTLRGHYVFFRVSDQRVHWLKARMKIEGDGK